jgi:hypothetical protein
MIGIHGVIPRVIIVGSSALDRHKQSFEVKLRSCTVLSLNVIMALASMLDVWG